MSSIEIVPGDTKNVAVFASQNGSIGSSVVKNAVGDLIVQWNDNGKLSDYKLLDARTGLSGGIYILKVTDGKNNLCTYKYTIFENKLLKILPGKTNDCIVYGDSTGSIDVTAISGGNGAYTITWQSNSTPIIDQNLRAKTNLAAGLYQITVVDGVGAVATHEYAINQTKELKIISGVKRNIALYGNQNSGGGSISQTVIAGGVAPYFIQWSVSDGGTIIPLQMQVNIFDTKTVHHIDNLNPGQYVLEVSDSVGAVVREVYNIKEGSDKIYYSFGTSSNSKIYS
jgi:hypothetical protein